MMLLLLSGCYAQYGYYPYGYNPYGYGAYPYPPRPVQQPYANAPPYGGAAPPAYGQPAAIDPNNCGTP